MNPDRAAAILRELLMTPTGELDQIPRRVGLDRAPSVDDLAHARELLRAIVVGLQSASGPNWEPVHTAWGAMVSRHGEVQVSAMGPAPPQWVRDIPRKPGLGDPPPGSPDAMRHEVEAAPMQAAPMPAAPMQAAPMHAAPMPAAPMQAAPMQAAPMHAAPMPAAPMQPPQYGAQGHAPVPAGPPPVAPVPIGQPPMPMHGQLGQPLGQAPLGHAAPPQASGPGLGQSSLGQTPLGAGPMAPAPSAAMGGVPMPHRQAAPGALPQDPLGRGKRKVARTEPGIPMPPPPPGREHWPQPPGALHDGNIPVPAGHRSSNAGPLYAPPEGYPDQQSVSPLASQPPAEAYAPAPQGYPAAHGSYASQPGPAAGAYPPNPGPRQRAQTNPGANIEMSVHKYAAFCAACAAKPDQVFSTMVEYGVTSPQAREALDESWQDRFDEDPALQGQWEELFAQYRAGQP